MTPVSFAAIGECMVELSGREGDLWRLGFAGDTFNTAFYAKAMLPANRRVAYVTAIGDDPFSLRLANFIAEAGVETDRLRAVPGGRPGLYAITLDGAERAFTYWRGESAARQLADDAAWLGRAVANAEMLYFSGITLAILRPDARARLLAVLAGQRAANARIAFDPNFRPALWPDKEAARAAMQAAYDVADIVLPTFNDEAALFGDASAEATGARIAAAGVSEVVVKNGDEPCVVITPSETHSVPAVMPETVVDTTGAGDSFCGTYLAARLMGFAPTAAAQLGHAVAAQVIGFRGALGEVEALRTFETAEQFFP